MNCYNNLIVILIITHDLKGISKTIHAENKLADISITYLFWAGIQEKLLQMKQSKHVLMLEVNFVKIGEQDLS